jgi:hypothetical protein
MSRSFVLSELRRFLFVNQNRLEIQWLVMSGEWLAEDAIRGARPVARE